jgi:DNA-binding NarL/FixJ family response regulator
MGKNAYYYIALADDHDLVRVWIKRIIEQSPFLEIVGEAHNGLELLELLRSATPDLILLDLSMPKLGGIDAARVIKKKYPAIKLLILTMHKRQAYLEKAMQSGVDGYMLKEDAGEELLPAIAALKQGKTYYSSGVSGFLRGQAAKHDS